VRRTYLLGLATCVALAAAIAVAARPGSAVRAGGLERGDASSIAFIASLTLAFGLYVAALLRLRRGGGRLVVVCGITATIQLLPLGGPLLLSRDVYSYWAYARIAERHERDPYVTSPAAFPGDAATRAVARGWRHTTSVYGPAFTAASMAVDRTATSRASVTFVFRVLAALAAIGTALLAAGIARRRSLAAAFVGWNPLLAIAFAGGGHNDALMVVLMLAALALAKRRSDVASGAAWVLAAAVKAPALFLLPLQLVHARRRVWLGAALAALAGSVAASLAFGSAWVTAILSVGGRESRYALPVRLEQAGLPAGAAHALAIGALVAGTAWLLRQSLRGRPRLALGSCLLLVTSPWLLPWYSSWPVALAAVEEDTTAQVLALVLAVYLLPARVPF
jgi:Glycosyltransferase family 87